MAPADKKKANAAKDKNKSKDKNKDKDKDKDKDKKEAKVVDPAAEAKREDELKASLRQLQAAGEQLKELRLAMRNMLQPLHLILHDPELLYAAFVDSAQKTVKEVKEFDATMRDDKMQEILKRAGEFDSGEFKGWLGELNRPLDSLELEEEEETGAATSKLDKLKIERQPTPKKR